jgi:hypothetical protein
VDATGSQNVLAFLLFVLLGAALAAVWCFLRAVRIQMREKAVFCIVLEAAFGVLCAVCIKLLALGVYWGEIRGFLLIGAGLGFWAVYETVGRLLTFLVGGILRFLVRFLLRPLGKLLCWILRMLTKLLEVPIKFVRKVALWVKCALKSAHRFVYNKKCAKRTVKNRKLAERRMVRLHGKTPHAKKAAPKAQRPSDAGAGRVLCVYASGYRQPANADKQPKSKTAEHSGRNTGTRNKKQRRSP